MMQGLLKFESFVPKNLDHRKVELEKKLAKDVAECNVFVQKFQKDLSALQGLKITDVQQQFIVNRLQNLRLETDPLHHPSTIFFFNQRQQCVLEYHCKEDMFIFHHKLIFKDFINRYDVVALDWFKMMGLIIEKIFKFIPRMLTYGVTGKQTTI